MAADSSLVPVSWTPLQAAQDALFGGCADRAAIAEYGAAVAFEKRVKGFAVGVVLGAAGCIGLALYLRSKDKAAAHG